MQLCNMSSRQNRILWGLCRESTYLQFRRLVTTKRGGCIVGGGGVGVRGKQVVRVWGNLGVRLGSIDHFDCHMVCPLLK
jgi:hypothetical protein